MKNIKAKHTKLKNKYQYILYFSFVPFLIKGISYLSIGAISPIVACLIITVPILYILYNKPLLKPKAIKLWSLLVLGYGIIRFLLVGIVFIAEDSIESSIVYQINTWYNLISGFYIITGLVLFLKRKELY